MALDEFIIVALSKIAFALRDSRSSHDGTVVRREVWLEQENGRRSRLAIAGLGRLGRKTMASRVDYSKFDKIVDSDEDDDNMNREDPVQGEVQVPQSSAAQQTPLVYAPPQEVTSNCLSMMFTDI